MKKVITSIVVLLTLLFLIYGAFYLGAFPDFAAKYNTIYTEDFSVEKFNQVKFGMTKQEVLDILGEPFYNEEALIYSKAKPHNQIIPPFAEDIWWTQAIVTFDENGKVMGSALNKFNN